MKKVSKASLPVNPGPTANLADRKLRTMGVNKFLLLFQDQGYPKMSNSWDIRYRTVEIHRDVIRLLAYI